MAAIAIAAASVLVALAVVVRVDDDPAPADLPTSLPSVPPTTEPTVPDAPVVGSWWSTDLDGSRQSMVIVRTGERYEVALRDDAADPCSETASTETGTGELDGRGVLVVQVLTLTCDDPDRSTAVEDRRQSSMTFTHLPDTDQLVDSIGVRWSRQVGEGEGMWPQPGLADVVAAQERADEDDPAVAWQLDPHLLTTEWWAHLRSGGSQLVERFLRDELGWDRAMFNPYQGDDGDGAADGVIRGLVYVRCAPGDTNPAYPAPPPGPQEALGAERCGPTIDDLRYEAVTLDLAQPGRTGWDGIWVVTRWARSAPFAQTDPTVAETEARGRLEEFLEARLAGDGAAGRVRSDGIAQLSDDVPLLYATTSGAPYERYEIERTGGPRWPYGEMDFTVRMFADGGATVVEQPIAWRDVGDARIELVHDPRTTTENGRPVPVTYVFLGGDVTASAPAPWEPSRFVGDTLLLDGSRDDERVMLVADPHPVASDCRAGPAPADAEALARSLLDDPDLVVAGPSVVTIGGLEGLVLDLAVSTGASGCNDLPAAQVLRAEDCCVLDLREGSRIRLHLIDLPGGAANQLLAVAVVAPDARFEEVLEAATPIVDSIDVRAG